MLCSHLCFQPVQSAFTTASAVILKTEMNWRQSHDTNTFPIYYRRRDTSLNSYERQGITSNSPQELHTQTTWRKSYASPQPKQICSNTACRKHVQAKEQTTKRACTISQFHDMFSLRILITLSALIVQKNFQRQHQTKYFCQHQFQMQSVWNIKDGGIKYVFMGCA